MNDIVMPERLVTGDDAQDSQAALAALIASRLCHDLISPLGAIGNGVELLTMAGEYPGLAKSPELQLVSESIEAARARIRLFRVAFGHSGAGQRIGRPELAALLADAEKGGRLKISLHAEGDCPRHDAKMVLLALMCVETALPWGGNVMILRAGGNWRLVAEAPRMKPDAALWALLDGRSQASAPAPSEAHFALLAAEARRTGGGLRWEMDEDGIEISF